MVYEVTLAGRVDPVPESVPTLGPAEDGDPEPGRERRSGRSSDWNRPWDNPDRSEWSR